MKNGDLVIMPKAVDRTLRAACRTTGIVVDDRVTRNRIGVLWADGDRVDFEPVDWLEVISESNNY